VVALFFFVFIFSNHASYILEKYSDFAKIKNFSDLGYNIKMPCRHVYEYVYADICPDCGRYTHEPDLDLSHKLFVEYYKSNKPKEYLCPVDGGTIRGWWSI
jgi:hypothetical protein